MLKVRIVFEYVIGKIKGRWWVLDKCLDEDLDRIFDIIIVVCVLYNICILRGENYDVLDDSDDSDSEDDEDFILGVNVIF